VPSAGGAVGLIGGPAGAMGGAAAGVMLTKVMRRVGLEVYERLIVRRQQERVGAVLAIAWPMLRPTQRQGGNPGLTDSSTPLPDYDQMLRRSFEGVLLHAAKCVPGAEASPSGSELPALAIRPEISAADGHWMTLLADRLTWRQLVVLSLFAKSTQ